MRSLVISLLVFAVTLALIDGEFLHGNHVAPSIVATRTIIGGAIGGAPSSGAFSAARYSQTIATPGTIHTIVSTHPIHHISNNANNNHQINNLGVSRGVSGGDTRGHSTSNYDSHQAHEGNNNGAQSNHGYGHQPNNNNNPGPSNYY